MFTCITSVYRPLEGSLEVEDQITPLQSGDDMQAKQEDHVTTGVVGHVTSDGSHHMETLETPFSRSRSATVSGGGRPKRMRRPKKATPSTHVTTVTDQSHVTSRDDHMTASNDSIPSSESQVMPPSSSSTSKKTEIVEQHMTASNDSIPSSESEVMPPSSSSTTVESKKTEIVEQETGSDEEVNSQKFIIKCQVKGYARTYVRLVYCAVSANLRFARVRIAALTRTGTGYGTGYTLFACSHKCSSFSCTDTCRSDASLGR